MFNRIIRWILPLVVLLLIALYLVLAPAFNSHAAAPTTSPGQTTPSMQPQQDTPVPSSYWYF